jgi:hypothetical protein
MGSIPNGSAPLQACARQIFKLTLLGRTGKAQVSCLNMCSDTPHDCTSYAGVKNEKTE